MKPPLPWKKPNKRLRSRVDGKKSPRILGGMKLTLLLSALWICLPLVQAGSCPESCGTICGTEKSCCPAQGKKCGSVQLERGGDPASAYSSKGGLRLR